MRATLRLRRAIARGVTTRRTSLYCYPGEGAAMQCHDRASRIGLRALDHGVVLTQAEADEIVERLWPSPAEAGE